MLRPPPRSQTNLCTTDNFEECCEIQRLACAVNLGALNTEYNAAIDRFNSATKPSTPDPATGQEESDRAVYGVVKLASYFLSPFDAVVDLIDWATSPEAAAQGRAAKKLAEEQEANRKRISEITKGYDTNVKEKCCVKKKLSGLDPGIAEVSSRNVLRLVIASKSMATETSVVPRRSQNLRK